MALLIVSAMIQFLYALAFDRPFRHIPSLNGFLGERSAETGLRRQFLNLPHVLIEKGDESIAEDGEETDIDGIMQTV